MRIFGEIWKDPVWSKVISAGIIAFLSYITQITQKDIKITLLTASIVLNLILVKSVIELNGLINGKKSRHDSRVATSILNKINKKKLDSFLNDLVNGHCLLDEYNNVRDVIELYDYNKFYSNRIQELFQDLCS
mgnify:CR=1 FL=1